MVARIRLIGGPADGRVMSVTWPPPNAVAERFTLVVPEKHARYRLVCEGVAVWTELDVQAVQTEYPVTWQIQEADPRTVERVAAECLRGLDRWCKARGYALIEESVDGSRKWDPVRAVTRFRAEALAYEDEGAYPEPPPPSENYRGVVRLAEGGGSWMDGGSFPSVAEQGIIAL